MSACFFCFFNFFFSSLDFFQYSNARISNQKDGFLKYYEIMDRENIKVDMIFYLLSMTLSAISSYISWSFSSTSFLSVALFFIGIEALIATITKVKRKITFINFIFCLFLFPFFLKWSCVVVGFIFESAFYKFWRQRSLPFSLCSLFQLLTQPRP